MGARATLFKEVELLRIENGGLKNRVERDEKQLSEYDAEITRLHEIIQKLKREAFGPRKERWESPEQILLFYEPESPKPKDDADDLVEVKGFKRRRGKRKPLPANLPREVVVIDVADHEKISKDGTPRRVIGEEISEKLIHEPAKIKVIEYHRLKYSAPDEEPGVIVAPAPPSILPKSIASASLLAHIITNKYADGLPLYRQEEKFLRHGIEIPRNTMARWIVQTSIACQGVWNALEERLMSSPYVSCDETRVQVLKEDGRTPESQSWMWIRATPSDKQKIVLFDYDPSRSGKVAQRLLAEYKGYLQVDGYNGYNALETQDGLVRLGCNMHGRRKFFDAKEGSSKGQGLACEGLKFYNKIYRVEKAARNLSWEERYELRLKEAAPIWDEMKEWADKSHDLVPPKSKIGEAFHYFLGEYQYLRSYLKDGRLEADNGFAERAIKYFAIGRKNWLFSDTVGGAEASSMFYSFVVTAKLNGVNPEAALHKIFEEVPLAKSADDYERISGYLCSKPPPKVETIFV